MKRVLTSLVIALAACQPLSAPSALAPVATRAGTFTDEHGNPSSVESFRGAPMVLSAIFTSCTVRCPLTVSKLRQVDDAFQKSGRLVPIVLLTLDPHTDTPERLVRFKAERKLPDHWHFLRGDDADTQALARQLRVNAAYDVGHIDHEVRIAVLDSSGRVAKSFGGWAFDPRAAVVR